MHGSCTSIVPKASMLALHDEDDGVCSLTKPAQQQGLLSISPVAESVHYPLLGSAALLPIFLQALRQQSCAVCYWC